MTAKEKAKELVEKFIPHTRVFHEELGWEDYIDSATQCALIAVDEIIKALSYQIGCNMDELQYYDEVKQEIEKL
jgi:hypothetical protein